MPSRTFAIWNSSITTDKILNESGKNSLLGEMEGTEYCLIITVLTQLLVTVLLVINFMDKKARLPDILQVYVFDVMHGLIEHNQRYSTVHTVFSSL